MNFEQHGQAAAAIIVGIGALAGLLRWLIVAALQPKLDAVHKRIDDHMRIEEADAIVARELQITLTEQLKNHAETLIRLDNILVKLDERTARLAEQVAKLDGRMGNP